jgi:hypothetical protein
MPVISGFGELAGLPWERINDKIERRVLAGKQGMIVWWKLKAGARAAPHRHPHEQIVWMLLRTWVGPMAATCRWTFDGTAMEGARRAEDIGCGRHRLEQRRERRLCEDRSWTENNGRISGPVDGIYLKGGAGTVWPR